MVVVNCLGLLVTGPSNSTVAWFGCGGADGDSCITVASTILTFLL